MGEGSEDIKGNVAQAKAVFVLGLALVIYNEICGQLDRTAALLASSEKGGKSELRRAVCRITSGKPVSKPADGKCHRKYTALAGAPEQAELGL